MNTQAPRLGQRKCPVHEGTPEHCQLTVRAGLSVAGPTMCGMDFGDPRLTARFWDLHRLDEATGCWLFTNVLTPAGRGRFRYDSDRPVLAHKLAYETLVGPVPEGRELDHTCLVRACANPDHLAPVTHKQNGENRAGANRNSKTGVRGVGLHKGRYVVRVRHEGTIHPGGSYATLDEAERAAIALRSRLFSNNLLDRSA